MSFSYVINTIEDLDARVYRPCALCKFHSMITYNGAQRAQRRPTPEVRDQRTECRHVSIIKAIFKLLVALVYSVTACVAWKGKH
jgi:hypothetical protein